MRLIRIYIYVLLLGFVSPTFALAEELAEQVSEWQSRGKRASKTTKKKVATTKARAKQPKKKASTKVSTRQARGKKSSRNVRVRAVRRASQTIAEEKFRLTQEDSVRFASGKLEPVMGQEITPLSEQEAVPMLARFRGGDTTLTKKAIESLYFGHRSKEGEYKALALLQGQVDEEIRASRFEEALVVARRGLFRNPLHLGLLKRACDLAHHIKYAKLELYVWQISEVLHLISNTGDGKTYGTAYRVMSASDALLFEHLWLDTPQSQIGEPQELFDKGQPLIALKIQPEGKEPFVRYYRVGHSTSE